MAEQPMSEEQLNQSGYHFERYGIGWIVAEYIGGNARYAGPSFEWTRQPIVRDQWRSKEDAIAAVSRWLAQQVGARY